MNLHIGQDRPTGLYLNLPAKTVEQLYRRIHGSLCCFFKAIRLGREEFLCRGLRKNPRLCRVDHDFEPFKKVGSRCCLFQAFCHPTSGKRRTCTPQTSIGPRFKVLAQKQMTITHIAGVNKF